jgi:AraC-like DNA-binding protein
MIMGQPFAVNSREGRDMQSGWIIMRSDCDKFRSDTGFTVTDVARSAGVSPSTLLRGFGESSQNSHPSLRTVEAVYELFGRPIPEEMYDAVPKLKRDRTLRKN